MRSGPWTGRLCRLAPSSRSDCDTAVMAIATESPARSAIDQRYRLVSGWLDGVPEPLDPRPPLPGDAQVDVAIAGGDERVLSHCAMALAPCAGLDAEALQNAAARSVARLNAD